MKTTVVNVKTDPYDWYIGRPFKVETYGRTKCIELYREYFHHKIKTDRGFREVVHYLKGKRLGCYCAPLLCHGDIIAEYLNKNV
mgnify:CR=1 FL=1